MIADHQDEEELLTPRCLQSGPECTQHPDPSPPPNHAAQRRSTAAEPLAAHRSKEPPVQTPAPRHTAEDTAAEHPEAVQTASCWDQRPHPILSEARSAARGSPLRRASPLVGANGQPA